jgi:hypothetical protein
MAEFSLPETRYALSGDVNVAYQVMGANEGQSPIDIVMVPGVVSHLEFQHELPGYKPFCAASRPSRVSSPSTSAARACPTASPARPRWSSAWTTCAP